jgi:hypothetical protein
MFSREWTCQLVSAVWSSAIYTSKTHVICFQWIKLLSPSLEDRLKRLEDKSLNGQVFLGEWMIRAALSWR